jgi:hypothetical protein
MTALDERRGRWALLIGIDRYPKLGSEWQLEGCGNDVAIVQDTLSCRFGFPDDHITVLRDEQATRGGILAAMDALIRRVGRDDEIVFLYSGHGSQQTDGPEADEADGLDETLVPFDGGRAPYPNRDITDDEIYLWLLRLTAITPFVTLIFDCCHAGTILRDAFGGKNRSVPADLRSAAEFAAKVPAEAAGLLAGGEDSPDARRRLGEKYVVIAACGSVETANEILAGEPRRNAHGALTYFLVGALRDSSFSGGTWREVFEHVAPQVTAHFRTQHPEVEGARDREVFGVRDLPAMTFLPVESRETDTAVLGAGTACGLTLGSRWQVYAPATRSTEDTSKYVGALEISSVGVTSSEARVVEEEKAGAIRPGARAVEASHALAGVLLVVEIAAPPGHPSAGSLAERIQGSRLLRMADPEGAGDPADVRVYLLEPRRCARPNDPAPMLGSLSEETWAPMGRDGALLAPAFPRRHPEALESLVANLENAARLRGVVGLGNPGSPLEKAIDFHLHRLEEGHCATPILGLGGEPVFFENDRLVLEIQNHSKAPLYVYVLDIGLTGRVEPVFPPLGSHEQLEIGHTLQVGRREGQELTLFIPKDYRLLHRIPEALPVEGQERLKLFATPSPANFEVLFLPGMRFPRGAGWSLSDVLNTTFHGGYGNLRTAEEWAVIDRTFLLRSRPAAKASA